MTLALLGNPNSGKTTLFNAMTGMRQHVGNFPGVTVERVQGPLRLSKGADVLVDLPGTYSLTAFSREEAVCGEFLREKPPDAIVNVVDATCPARGLYLTLQLLETGLPVVVAMNLMDEVRAAGGRVDCRALSRALDVPVLPVCAARNEGVEALARAALAAAREGRAPRLPDLGTAQGEARILARYACIDRLCARAVAEGTSAARRRTAAADAVLTHRIWAFPIFLGVMGLVFFLTFGPLGGLLSQGFRRALEGAGALLETALARMGAADWLRAMMVEGVWAGVGCVLSFLPTILTLFFLLSILEDSGYMARMAFVADRALRRLGLSGRSLAPALLGFGCSVPAILATRTLPSRRAAANAAMQGVYKRVKTRKETAASGVNTCGSAAESAASVGAASRTLSAASTPSFASRPESSAVAARQSPKPSGANSGATARPMAARALSAASGTGRKAQSTRCSAQSATEASSSVVSAQRTNAAARTRIRRQAARSVGMR